MTIPTTWPLSVSESPRPPASRSGRRARRSRCADCSDWISAAADPGGHGLMWWFYGSMRISGSSNGGPLVPYFWPYFMEISSDNKHKKIGFTYGSDLQFGFLKWPLKGGVTRFRTWYRNSLAGWWMQYLDLDMLQVNKRWFPQIWVIIGNQS